MLHRESSAGSEANAWKIGGSITLVYLAALFAAFHDTLGSMIAIWSRSDTFAHGYLILPVSLWLIWRKRAELKQRRPRPEWVALLPMVGGGAVWLLARVADVQVIQQFSFVFLLVCGVWHIWGTEITKTIIFPLCFLFFAVPVGEGLIGPMMEFTAIFLVAMVELTGIPVFREGLFIHLPSATWSVVEACSGVRYLIASVTLGVLFAYLTYTSYLKRAVFILLSVVVPVIANGLRAYMIVMIGHLSDMRLATGVDHFIYGWVFFGLIMFILFMIGSIWRDEDRVTTGGGEAEAGKGQVPGTRGAIASGAAVVVLALLWPLVAASIESRTLELPAARLALFPEASQLRPAENPWEWEPRTWGSDKHFDQSYSYKGEPYAVHLRQYLLQKQGAELVNSQNTLLSPEQKQWRQIRRHRISIELDGRETSIEESVLNSRGKQLLVWSWYRVGDSHTANPYRAKALEALRKIAFSHPGSARLVVATEIETVSYDDERNALNEFVQVVLPDIEAALDAAAGKTHGTL